MLCEPFGGAPRSHAGVEGSNPHIVHQNMLTKEVHTKNPHFCAGFCVSLASEDGEAVLNCSEVIAESFGE